MRFDDELDVLDRDEVRGIFERVETRNIIVPVEGLEFRESGSGDGSFVLTGYASVFNQRTTLYEGDRFRWTESVAERAFDRVLATNPDVHLNMGHDMNRSMARTKAPGPLSKLELATDAHGLRVFARLNPENRTVQELVPLMRDRVMDQMSFAFTVKRSGIETLSYTDESGIQTDEDTIVDIDRLYDVCVCAQGAYPTTEASLRTLLTSRDTALTSNREVSRTEDGAADDPQVASETDGAQDDPAVSGVSAELERELEAASVRFTLKGAKR